MPGDILTHARTHENQESRARRPNPRVDLVGRHAIRRRSRDDEREKAHQRDE